MNTNSICFSAIITAPESNTTNKYLMKRSVVLIVSIFVVFCALSIALSTTAQITAQPSTGGGQDPAGAGSTQRRRPGALEDFDIRANVARSLPAHDDPSRDSIKLPPRGFNARQSRLLRSRPDAQIRLSSLTGTPSRIFSLRQTLSEPGQSDAEATARRFLKNNSDLYRLSDSEVDRLVVTRRYRTERSRVTHLFLQQRVNEVEVFQGEYAIHIDRDGAVVAASGELAPDASKSINLSRPRLSAVQSLGKAAEYADVEIKGSLRLRKKAEGVSRRQLFSNEEGGAFFGRDVETRLIYFPLSSGQLRLAWEFILWKRETPDAYLIIVDAERGSLLYRYNMTWRCFERPLVSTQIERRVFVPERRVFVPEGHRILAGGGGLAEPPVRRNLFPSPERASDPAQSVALSGLGGLSVLFPVVPPSLHHRLISDCASGTKSCVDTNGFHDRPISNAPLAQNHFAHRFYPFGLHYASAAHPAQDHFTDSTFPFGVNQMSAVDGLRNHFATTTNSSGVNQPSQTPHGLVFTKDSPRPDVPHVSDNPAIVDREDVQFRPAPFNGATIFAPNDPHFDWWAGQPATGLISNNVDTRLDRDNNNQPDLPRLNVAGGNFSFPIDFAQAPVAPDNQRAAQVNLFYWINRYHDILYAYGFNEAAGNFQTNNFGLGGVGNDAVIADAQDGSGTNNANFLTPRDGSPGRMQMYLWSTANPQLDGDFDQSVIIHELTHGLSGRLVGNATGLAGMQGRGMGEGWSDYFGIVLLRNENDDLDGTYAVGQYVINNYARGIRRFPYSADPQVYPYNFGDIARSNEVHNVGEIWCATLLEMRAQLIGKLGFLEGQRQSIQLVVDGLKLTPINPTFLDARNAIMLADKINNGGANQCAIWQAFSKRGMGLSASTIDSGDHAPVESFDVPPSCSDLGSVRFNQRNYLSGETMKITVGDRNAPNAPGQVKVVARSSVTNDEETLTLSEDAIFNGLFSANLRVAGGRAIPGDGSLQASLQAGDKIIVSYNDSNSGAGGPAQVSAETDVAGEAVVIDDNVETGNTGWSASGTPEARWAISGERSNSPVRAWTDSPGGNYANNSDNSLVSPLLDLSRAAGVVLSFAHRYDLEPNFDYGIVEYSIDDGASWKRVVAFTGLQPAFTQARVNLDALSQSPRARIRFRVLSDDFSRHDGWTIDDIRVIARSSDFTYLPPQSALAPSIASVSPAWGPPDGGAEVTISGLNFTETGDARVFFDNLPATNVRVIGASVIKANTPRRDAGAVTVRVETRNGVATLANAFTYFVQGSASGAPELSNIFPATGSSGGGTAVTIYGSNFTPQTVVAFGNQDSRMTTFINSTTLRAVTPGSPNNATGVVDVTASNPQSAQTRLAGVFNYAAPAPPTVNALYPLGGETVFAGGVVSLRWRSSDDRAVARHRIALYRSSQTAPILITDISNDVAGEAQSFNWTIPITTSPTTLARIRVTAVDDEGAATDAFTSGDFTIDRRWAPSAPLPIALNRLAVTSDGQYLYSIGGRTTTNNATAVATVQRLDPSSGSSTWSSAGLAHLPVELNAIEAATIQGKIYVPGGFTRQTTIDRNMRIYDIASNSWSAQTPPPTGVGQYALAADAQNSALYITGGSDLTSAVSNVQAYDTNADTWQALPPMKSARYGHEAALIDGRLYVVGGIGPSGGAPGGEVYDFQTGQWSPIASPNQPRFHAVNAVTRDETGRFFWLVFGGADANTGAPLSSAEAYDVANNRWIALDGSFSFQNARTLFNGAVHNGFLYAVGGSTAGAANDRFDLAQVNGFTLINTNQPPLVVVPPVQQIAIPTHELKFGVLAQDLGSGSPITITADGLPPGAVFNAVNDTNNSARGEFRWTPQTSDIGGVFTVNFTAGDGSLNDVKSVVIRVVSAGPLTPVNAADFHLGPLAADSIVAAFGLNLANRIDAAQSLPLPTSLAGTTLTVNGIPAPLFYVSSTQINFVVPPTIDPGPAVVIASNPVGSYSLGVVQIVPSAPAIFTADSTGKGDAAALATIDGINYQQQPFDVLVNGAPNTLVFYGTGIRRAAAANPGDDNGVSESVSVTIDGRSARVLYAGAQGAFSGLDQINVETPASLAGSGMRRVEVVVTVNNIVANTVTIQIK